MIDTVFSIAIVSLVLGSCFGSFANMIIYRLCSEHSIFGLRSICPKCKTPLGVIDLIPIISFLLCRGRCRSCNQPILKRYIIVELIVPVLFFLFLYPQSFMFFNLHYLIFGFSLIILFFTDLESFLLPLPLTSLLIILGLTMSFLDDIFLDRLLPSLVIGVGFLLFRMIANFIYKQDTFGLGDIILLVALSLNLGWQICIASFYAAIILGSLFSLILILLKQRSRKDFIPFGPFIIIGILCSHSFLELVSPFLFLN